MIATRFVLKNAAASGNSCRAVPAGFLPPGRLLKTDLRPDFTWEFSRESLEAP
jgi:hypothetical protein